MKQLWNQNYNWFLKLDLLVSSVMVTLFPMSLDPTSLKGRCTSVALPRQKLQNGLEFSTEICSLLKKLSKEHFGILKLKIWIIYGLIAFQFLSGALY